MKELLLPMSAGQLRRQISYLNSGLARKLPHELTIGSVPSVIYQALAGEHGNFHPESYQSILSDERWARRLTKSYSAAKRVPRRWDRQRCELDCANSSDALLMNLFCHPQMSRSRAVSALLGVECGLVPKFGFKPAIPLLTGRTDQTEIDMQLGSLLVEAKLTEGGFQTAPLKRLMLYRDFEETFDVERLTVKADKVQSYQLIRGVLAAVHLDQSFVVFCDRRRADLIERWFQVISAVRDCTLRSRLALLTWQEIAAVAPETLANFVRNKYGICA